jgi:spore coat polysaccharide biosynthesis protein SpsF (cytidylyltransferase family)
MATITIELTETQYKGLEYIAESPQDWAENAVTERCRIANDEIVQMTVQHCLDNGEQIPTTREEIVAHGFEHGVVKTAAVRQEEAEAAAAAMAAEQAAALAAEQAESTPTEGA